MTTGVSQGSVLSPFLCNLALARVPDYIPCDTPYDVRVVIYADDIALFARGPTHRRSAVLSSIQTGINAVDAYLKGIGLTLAASKTEALIVHPIALTRFRTPRLSLHGVPIPWSKTFRYLGVTIDTYLLWPPAVSAMRKNNHKVLHAATASSHKDAAALRPLPCASTTPSRLLGPCMRPPGPH